MVVHDGRILEKPQTEDEVRRNIAGYAVSVVVEFGLFHAPRIYEMAVNRKKQFMIQ